MSASPPKRAASKRPASVEADPAALPDARRRIWFTADSHFGHGGALGRFRRPFGSVAEMDEGLVARWNKAVAPEDEVWHLGDFAYRVPAERVSGLLRQLNGRKHLLTGNNDGPSTREAPEWTSVGAYAELTVDGTRLILCHYAFRTWDGMYKGAWNLHGHSHGALKPLPRQADVGVDVWDFRPVNLAAIMARRSRRKAQVA
jgi:calcineurin-like phosphoesterase family protein